MKYCNFACMLYNYVDMKIFFIKYILILSLVVFCICCKNIPVNNKDVTSVDVDSFPILMDHIRNYSRMYTTEYKVHKIITHDDQLKLQGKLISKSFDVNIPLGQRKIAIPIDATIKGYIDFSLFSDNNVKRSDGKIEIILPDPKFEITSSRIDHDAIINYVPLFRSDFTDKELSSYEQQGRQAIVKSIAKMGIIEQARISAANVLIPLISQFGYEKKNIKITFREDLNEYDMNKLIVIKEISNETK